MLVSRTTTTAPRRPPDAGVQGRRRARAACSSGRARARRARSARSSSAAWIPSAVASPIPSPTTTRSTPSGRWRAAARHRVDGRGIAEVDGRTTVATPVGASSSRLGTASLRPYRISPPMLHVRRDAPARAGTPSRESVTRQPAASISDRGARRRWPSPARRAPRTGVARRRARRRAPPLPQDVTALPIVRRGRADDLVDDAEVQVVEALEPDAARPRFGLRQSSDVRLEVQGRGVQRDVVLLRGDPEHEPLALAPDAYLYRYVP